LPSKARGISHIPSLPGRVRTGAPVLGRCSCCPFALSSASGHNISTSTFPAPHVERSVRIPATALSPVCFTSRVMGLSCWGDCRHATIEPCSRCTAAEIRAALRTPPLQPKPFAFPAAPYAPDLLVHPVFHEAEHSLEFPHASSPHRSIRIDPSDTRSQVATGTADTALRFSQQRAGAVRFLTWWVLPQPHPPTPTSNAVGNRNPGKPRSRLTEVSVSNSFFITLDLQFGQPSEPSFFQTATPPSPVMCGWAVYKITRQIRNLRSDCRYTCRSAWSVRSARSASVHLVR